MTDTTPTSPATPATKQIEMYKAAIGDKNQAYYLEKFSQFDANGGGFQPSWNWGAFPIIFVWALYRKMYKFALLYSLLFAVITIFSKLPVLQNVISAITLALIPIFAISGNWLYYRMVKAKVKKVEESAQSEEAVISSLKSSGGINVWVLYVYAAFWVTIALILLWVNFLAKGDKENTGKLSETPAIEARQTSKESGISKPDAETHASGGLNEKNVPSKPAKIDELYASFGLLNLGDDQSQKQIYTKSIDNLTERLRINPEDADDWNQLGNAYQGTKQYPKAINAYQEAVRIKPEFGLAWNNLGIAYQSTKQYPKAIYAHQEVLRIYPEYATAWSDLGNAYANTKQYPKAINALQQALLINPKYASAWYNLGHVYTFTDDRVKVMDVYKKLKVLDPAMADKFFNAHILPGG
jgi:tetratricopeptide (TPR) repeat protein